MIDRTTKMLLTAIAAGLWANAFALTSPVTPALAITDSRILQKVEAHLDDINTNILNLVNGACANRKLCTSN